MTNEQKLIDIMFEVGLMIHKQHEYFETRTTEQVAQWIADQLSQCGFNTTACGSSWGVLDR